MVILNYNSRTNSSTLPWTMNFSRSSDQMEYTRANNVCLKQNNFSHLNIRASAFHDLLKYFKKSTCNDRSFGTLAKSACLLQLLLKIWILLSWRSRGEHSSIIVNGSTPILEAHNNWKRCLVSEDWWTVVKWHSSRPRWTRKRLRPT